MTDIKTKSDSDLLTLRKNEDVTVELINRYKPIVEAIAMKYINSPLEKDDLIQEGMIGLLAAINFYKNDKGASFSTYAGHCINNSICSALKRISRLKDIPQKSLIPLDDSAFDDVAYLSAEDEYLAKESVATLSDTLYEELSDFENEVLRLYIVGCSYSEIANKLDKNQKAIDNAIQRIRKKLKGVTF